MTVSKDKQYKTKDGREVRIYTIERTGREPVHGAVKQVDTSWSSSGWDAQGFYYGPDVPSDSDLVEVKPEIRGFMNVYAECHPDVRPVRMGVAYPGTTIYATRDEADEMADNAMYTFGLDRIACLPVTFHEGEGL